MATDDTQPATLAHDLLVDGFERVHEEFPQVVERLSVAELCWRPDADANSVGWLLWHLTRVQDDHMAGLAGALGDPCDQVWSRWRDQFDLPYDPDDIGYGQTSEQVGAFTVKSPAQLTKYHEGVHELTLEVLGRLKAEDYTRVVDENFDPPVTAAARLVSVLNDITAHIGQAAYVKGMLLRTH
ncbi:mycothiol transferase [Mobilicoccus massiliensis]|uniref:mycothiol transferase n=1 Tax=Mobilicoccus massiliensis TaxID=1522310 RepID=UPI00058FFC81|nr:DinB family protein [Mobilicoccus massiliensis]